MMSVDVWALLSIAFGLGILHALDADHIIAVTGLSCQKTNKKASVLFCARWAIGHGGALLIIGAAVMFLGMAIPQELSSVAENLVGLVLIGIGVFVLWDIYRTRSHLHFHHHDGLPNHAHWHHHQQSTDEQQSNNHQHSHAPVFVGVLHGVAGSAPLLVLLPISQLSSPWQGISYLLLFGCGVFLAMLIFGGLIGQVFGMMKQWGNKFITALRLVVSLVAIAYGSKLLVVAF